MSRKNISNYAIAILLTFAITSVGLTYFVFPSYAAPTVTTFFSCETTDGCGYRYNSTLYLAPLPNNMTAMGDWSSSSLVFEMLGNESIIINGSAIPRSSPNALLHLAFKPAINGTMGLHIITDLNGQPDAESLEVEVNASSISAGLPVVFNAVIDKGASTGGDIHAYNVIITGSGTIQVVGLGVFSGVDPIHQHSGSPVNMDRALLYDGAFSDVTAAFTATGNDTSMFVGNGDSVYIGHASKFGEIQFNLDTLASGAGIQPTFEFSTGAGGWTLFSPIDATDGMRDDGAIAYEKDDLTGWATDTVSGFVNNFWIRINRTQVGLGTVPIEDLVQIVIDTDFIWNENGDVQILGLNVTGNLIVSGTSDFNGIVDGNNNAFNNIGAACNDLGDPNAFCASNFGGIVSIGGFNLTDLNVLRSSTTDFTHQIFTDDIILSTSNAADNAAVIRLTIPGTVGFTTAAWSSTVQTGIILGGTMNGGNNVINAINALHGDDLAQLTIQGNSDTAAATSRDIIFNTLNEAGNAHVERFSISGNAASNGVLMMSNGNFAVPSNNTLSMFSDAVRVANIFSVVNTAKSQVTGLLLESDFIPNVGESFETGDIVCFYSLFKFTKCNSDGDSLVIGPVYILGERGIIGYENVTKYRLVEKIEYYAKNVTDADGNIDLVRASRIVKESYRETRTILLDNGTVIVRQYLAFRSIWINQSFIESVPIWGDVSSKTLTVIEGPLSVKACGTVLRGQFLISGSGGCAKGVDTLTPDLRYFGIAVSNSRGGYVDAYMP